MGNKKLTYQEVAETMSSLAVLELLNGTSEIVAG